MANQRVTQNPNESVPRPASRVAEAGLRIGSKNSDLRWLGIDVGGANLKLANLDGYATSVPFALWKNPAGLAAELATRIDAAPASGAVAVTMTGELADCFATKREGVAAIVDAAVRGSRGRAVWFGRTDGTLVPAASAVAEPLAVAAANWFFLAAVAGEHCAGPGGGLLIDIGSTTTDLIPLSIPGPASVGRTDVARLLSRELVYTGVGRTPVFGVVEELPYRGESVPVAREVFATTGDAYVLLDRVKEDERDTATADGRPRTKAYAVARLARMIGLDHESFSHADARLAAEHIHRNQLHQIVAALEYVLHASSGINLPATVVTSGSGEFLAAAALARILPDTRQISLSEQWGHDLSQAATAYAVARVAAEQTQHGL